MRATAARARRTTRPGRVIVRAAAAPKPEPSSARFADLRRRAAALAAAAVVSAGTALGAGAAPSPPPSLPLDPARLTVQRTMVQAWDAVARGFVDAPGVKWEATLTTSLAKAASAADAPAAYREIGAMLDRLGDPYTRIVSPDEYASFRLSAEGELQGVGLLIATDPASAFPTVVAPLDGSPAARAGIRPGDRVLSIDGAPTAGWGREQAAARLRGARGSTVVVRVAAGDGANPSGARAVRLTRELVELSPVTSALMQAPGNHPVGYVRLAAFTARAPADVRAAVASLANSGARAFVLDLRGNPGGLVGAGVDVASVWLDGGAPVFSVAGRGEAAQTVALDAERGGALVPVAPLAVLVDAGSASASEIVAGALHDNRRATLVGKRTFGKGKIQHVTTMADGSALFLTVARYLTPDHHAIDGVGIAPDAACAPGRGAAPLGAPRLAASIPGVADALRLTLDDDPCVKAAERLLAAKLGAKGGGVEV